MQTGRDETKEHGLGAAEMKVSSFGRVSRIREQTPVIASGYKAKAEKMGQQMAMGKTV